MQAQERDQTSAVRGLILIVLQKGASGTLESKKTFNKSDLMDKFLAMATAIFASLLYIPHVAVRFLSVGVYQPLGGQ